MAAPFLRELAEVKETHSFDLPSSLNSFNGLPWASYALVDWLLGITCHLHGHLYCQ